jgi:catechol 2,3-dioxygenase-like lactoylglutathione lyase family enzyme
MVKAEKFYDAIMDVLGHKALFKLPDVIAYGELTGEKLFILPPFDGNAARAGNGGHVAFKTDSRAQVDAFHKAALAHGGTDEGPPGLRTHYHPNYYGPTCAIQTETRFKQCVTARTVDER